MRRRRQEQLTHPPDHAFQCLDLLQQALDHLAVVGDAAGDRADLMLVVVAQSEGMEFIDELRTEIERERIVNSRSARWYLAMKSRDA